MRETRVQILEIEHFDQLSNGGSRCSRTTADEQVRDGERKLRAAILVGQQAGACLPSHSPQEGLAVAAGGSGINKRQPAPAQGFGGIAAESVSGRARAWVETAAAQSPVGTKVGRIDVFYLERPKGGRFTVRVDGRDAAEIETAAAELGAGYRRIEVADGPHRIGFVAESRVRLFGVALERSEPGIVVDSLASGERTRCCFHA